MVMSFLVPISVSFRSSSFQLTTVTEYQMAARAKVSSAVTLFMIENFHLRTRLTRCLYSEVALHQTFWSLLPNDGRI